MEKCEEVNPYGTTDSRAKGEQVRQMFDSIAPSYDLMNNAMTMGIHRLWRNKALRHVIKSSPLSILDIATGTGDVAFYLAGKLPEAHIAGVDLSQKMLDVAIAKLPGVPNHDNITFRQADCLALPFDDASFDAVTIAYGVRNLEHLLEGYKEMFRVLKPGGVLCVIELSTPQSPVIRPLYNLYAKHIIPAVGKMVSHDNHAYRYLPESIAKVPQAGEMTALMEQAGFKATQYRTLTFGACSYYMAHK